MPVRPNNISALIDERVTAIKVAHLDAGITKAELDLSGGIDSAVMACLLVTALGPENVTLVHSQFKTNPKQTARAVALAEGLNCPLINIDLGAMWDVLLAGMMRTLVEAHSAVSLYDLKRRGYTIPTKEVPVPANAPGALTQFMGSTTTVFDVPDTQEARKALVREQIEARCESDKTILGSIRSCLRAPIGRGYNRLTGGGLRYGTGNECEDRWLRFYQKGGDGEVDNNPMAFLSKGEVYQMAWMLSIRIPMASTALIDTINAVPSPDLWGEGDGHSDEAELLSWTGAPFTYSRINITTGKYAYVGTIERVNRFLDLPIGEGDIVMDQTYESDLFNDMPARAGRQMDRLTTAAKRSGLFNEFSRSEVETLLMAARKAERITRHKMNPNCPTYGDRASLVKAGILTNDLPTMEEGE
jgi:NH3-dependent NAD+ synthetase